MENAYKQHNHKTEKFGNAAVDKFISKCNNLSVKYRMATDYEDRKLHHDIYVLNGSKEIGIDIKAHKKRRRFHNESDQTLCFLELANWTGKYAWTDGTGYIGFQYNNEFILVLKSDLRQYLSNNIDRSKPKLLTYKMNDMSDSQIVGNVFYRKDAPNEAVTMVSWDTIKELAKRII